MEFKRDIYQALLQWKNKVIRKPLLVMGARQIGKTTAIKGFGKQEFQDVLYINFEKQLDVHSFFLTNKDPAVILDNLSLVHGKSIQSEKTLMIFDEIQECRDALIALKYFAEELPELHIIGAGSLLGLTIGNDRSFPVGKVEFLEMYPLSFPEYLSHSDQRKYKTYEHYIKADAISQIPNAFFNPLKESFKEYLIVGGMPEIASHYLEHRNLDEAQKIQDQILKAYALDFVKNASRSTSTKIQHVWHSIPSQLAKENKKFLYKVVRSGVRAREYKEAIQWLIQAGLLYKISRVEKVGIPMKAYEDVSAFKLYLFEAGLLMRMADISPSTIITGDQFFTEFKGSLAENFVAQSLRKIYGKPPYYWASEGKAEIDFLVNHYGNNIPIEVKAGTATKAKSLVVYKKRYTPKLRVRISNNNLQQTDDLLNVPIFYAEYVNLFIDKALA